MTGNVESFFKQWERVIATTTMNEIEAILSKMRLEVGHVTDGEGRQMTDEAIIFFEGDDGSSEIRVQAENASVIARRLVRLWNGDSRK